MSDIALPWKKKKTVYFREGSYDNMFVKIVTLRFGGLEEPMTSLSLFILMRCNSFLRAMRSLCFLHMQKSAAT